MNTTAAVRACAAVVTILAIACRADRPRDGGEPRDSSTHREPAAASAGDWLLAPDSSNDAVHATDSEASLRARYGAENVTRERIYQGEGESAPGTVLFPHDPRRRVEIDWADTVGWTRPARVRLLGDSSRWKIVPGVTLGTRLSELERLNGRPFDLFGMEFDYSGTVNSWYGGRLDSAWASGSADRRRVWLRLRPDRGGDPAHLSSVAGERLFMSTHPAMRALDPRVYDLFIEPR